MYGDRWESDWNFQPTTKPNSSRIFINWPTKTLNISDEDKQKKKLPNEYHLPPEKVILNIKPISLGVPTENLIENVIISDKQDENKYESYNNTGIKQGSSNSTGSHQVKIHATKLPTSISHETNQRKQEGNSTGTTNTNTTTTKRPNSHNNKKGHLGRYPLNSIDSEELKALRPPTRSPENDLWLEQMHAITTPKPYDPKRDCGIRSMSQSNREARVVGGRNSQMGEFPWSVLIRETSLLGLLVKTKCGGVLIDLKWVLTAAHCKPGMFGSLVVMVGEHDLNPNKSSGPKLYQTDAGGNSVRLKPAVKKVKRMIIHRDYNPSNFDNDIALLELEAPFQMQPHVVPICLPEKEEEFIGQNAMVAGWGKLSFGGPVPSVLQVARLPVIGSKQCQDMYHHSGHIKIISDSFVCAGFRNGGKDSCEGDSGGPLQVQRNDSRWVLVGTVSHGIKCAEPNLPGIYIRTSAYLPWIKAVMFQQDYNKRYGHSLEDMDDRV